MTTQVNRTLDSLSVTFPIDRDFYADFSHDNQMISIYSVLGLFVQPHHLDPTVPNAMRTWFDSKLVPLLSPYDHGEARACESRGDKQVCEDFSKRWLAAHTILWRHYSNGLCTLKNFVESQQYARMSGAGDWDLCFD